MYSVYCFLVTVVTTICLFQDKADATRLFERRDDLLNLPPVSASGWTVPLQGGSEDCQYGGGNCTDMSLTGPAINSRLEALAIGKGLLNFTCATTSQDPNQDSNTPVFVNQYTELYNAAPLITTLPNEDTFHSLVPLVLDYNYEQAENGSLNCMGTVGTLNGTAVITLFDIDTFEADPVEEVPAADDSDNQNTHWTRSISVDDTWQVYRVETSGGQPPASCQGQPDVFELEYAAEYWFYRQSR